MNIRHLVPLGLTLALGAASTSAKAAAAPADERVRIRAEYEEALARLRAKHQKEVAEVRADLADLEPRMQVVRRLLPPAFEADATERQLRALAQASEMSALEVRHVSSSATVRLADGRATPYERFYMEVAGSDRYNDLGFFLDRLDRLPRIVELETLSLEAGPDDTVRFAARLAFPCMTGWPASPAPAPLVPPRPAGATAAPTDERRAREDLLREYAKALERGVDAAREPLRRIQAEVAAIDEMRNARSPARFFAALMRFDAKVDRRTLSLSRARFGTEVAIEGVVGGGSARAALGPALEEAGFTVDTLEIAPTGWCRTFALAARLRPREESAGGRGIEVGPSPFDHRAEPACRATPQAPAASIVARGTGGDLSVRLREADVVDVFRLLHELTPASFIVDADVKGRLNVDLERATLEEALAAMAPAGVTVGPGPLRRVSRAGTRPSPASPPRTGYTETSISLSFKDAVLLDVLRLFEDVAGRSAWTSPVVDGRVNVFFSEVPWDQALRAIAASAGMAAVIEAERIFVGPPAMAKAPWRSGAVEVRRATTTDGGSAWGRVTELSKVGPEDLAPLGLAQREGAWKAVAYGPGRLLWILEPGVELLGARVQAVGPKGVTFEAADGRRTEVAFGP